MAGPVKRFIAGARCPSCGAMDTVYICKGESGMSRHCTRCSLNEKQDESRDGKPEETPKPVSEWAPVRIKD